MNVVKHDSLLVLLGRAFWVMFGPLLLTASGLMILMHPGRGWRTGADITFLVTLVLMIVARWIEFSGGQPMKSTGGPATIDDFRGYAVLILPGGIGFWLLANVISNYLFT